MTISVEEHTTHKRVGETRLNNHGSKMTIIEYKGRKDITIYFPDSNYTSINKSYSNFAKGNIRNPYDKIICGVGYLDEGNIPTSFLSKRGKYESTRTYGVWQNMLKRCYNPTYQNEHPTHKECTVCEEWYNFQTFAKWYNENYYEIDEQRMNLDKDILIKGNKSYNPNTCVFVPATINNLFIKRNKSRGEYPIGVCFYRGKYLAFCNNKTGIQVSLGSFENSHLAFNSYKNYKENYIKEIANMYKSKIPLNLYEAMLNYKVEESD